MKNDNNKLSTVSKSIYHQIYCLSIYPFFACLFVLIFGIFFFFSFFFQMKMIIIIINLVTARGRDLGLN